MTHRLREQARSHRRSRSFRGAGQLDAQFDDVAAEFGGGIFVLAGRHFDCAVTRRFGAVVENNLTDRIGAAVVVHLNGGDISICIKGVVIDAQAVQLLLNVDRIGKRSCLLYTSPSPRDRQKSRMPSSA